VIDRYDNGAEAFQLGVDHDTYHPEAVERQPQPVSTTRLPGAEARPCRIGADGASTS